MIPTANLTLLYGNLALEARFEAARRDGFSFVEILFPYDRAPHWYAERLQEHDLKLALVNTPTDADTARWGVAALPSQTERFRGDLRRAAEVCEATGCPAIHVMAGCVPPTRHNEAFSTLLDNLRWATAAFPALRMQLEALNEFDVPGYFYSEPKRVQQVLESLSASNAGMQFDFYHVVRQGLDLLAELETALPWLRYVQVAGSPSRHEPDLTQDSLLQGFTRLHQAGYQGNVGFEYRPAASPSDGLRWAQPLSNYFSFSPTSAALR